MSDSEGPKGLSSEQPAEQAEAKTNASESIARMQRAADTLGAEIEKPAAKVEAAVAPLAKPEPVAAKGRRVKIATVKPAVAAIVADRVAPETEAKTESAAIAAPKIENIEPMVRAPDIADMIAVEEQKISMLAGKAAALRAQQAKQAKGAGMFAAQGWGRAAAGAALVVALSGAAFLGLRDGAGGRSGPVVAGAQPAKPTPEQMLAAETQDLRRQLHALSQEVQTLRASAQKQADETRTAQTHAAAANAALGQTTARLDRIEREATTKLEKQATRVDRLERLSADPVVTSTIDKSAAAHALPKKPDAPQATDPAVSGADYVLRSVRNGVAVVQTRRGMIEVSAGDTIPGVGRVRAIEKIDGRWVVVTRDGVIDAD